MKGYKAFEKGLICKDKQYSENTVFEESDAIIQKKRELDNAVRMGI